MQAFAVGELLSSRPFFASCTRGQIDRAGERFAPHVWRVAGRGGRRPGWLAVAGWLRRPRNRPGIDQAADQPASQAALAIMATMRRAFLVVFIGLAPIR
jgi:hypothetical protein